MNSDAKMICRSIDRLTDEARKLRRTMIRNNINAEIDLHEDDEESENRTKTSPPICWLCTTTRRPVGEV